MKQKIIIEDLDEIELDTTDSVGVDINNYTVNTKTSYGSPFYIVFFDEIKSALGLDSDDIEYLCDNQFGVGNWGDSDSWSTCDECYNAIYLDDYYHQDFWANDNGGLTCVDCVRQNPEEYLDNLTNNPHSSNWLLTSDTYFEDAGFTLLDIHPRVENQEVTLQSLLRDYPEGKFIFDITRYGTLNVWAKNINDEEE